MLFSFLVYSTIWVKQPTVHPGRKNSSGFQNVNLTNIVFCKACNKPFRISGSGIEQVKCYHRKKKHLEQLGKLQNGKQRTFTCGENG